MYSEKELDHFANIIVELYSNPKIKEFKPTLNKGLKRDAGSNVNSSNKTKHAVEIRDYMNLYVNYEYSDILGKENIETILKKTLQCNLQPKIELTKNGIVKEELKKTIDILKLHINNLNAKSTNDENNKIKDEIAKKTEDLKKLEEKFELCLKEKNFDKTTDYKDISIKCLKILSDASFDFTERKNSGTRFLSKKEECGLFLYNLVRQKLGLGVKKNNWELEKEYEYVKKSNNLADIVCDKLKIDKPIEIPKPQQNLHDKFFGYDGSYNKYKKPENKKNSYVPPHQKHDEKTTEKTIELFDLGNTHTPVNQNLGSWNKKLTFEEKKDFVVEENTKIECEKISCEEKVDANEWCLDD